MKALSVMILGVLATAAAAGCDRLATQPSLPAHGVQLARESLATIDDSALPCCASWFGQAISGGVLTFYAADHYDQMVATPAGMRPAACVQGVPNGAYIHMNTVVTLGDSVAYLLIPCSAGVYSLTLSVGLGEAPAVSQGTYTAARDTLLLEDDQGVATATIVDTTITIVKTGHRFTLQPFRSR